MRLVLFRTDAFNDKKVNREGVYALLSEEDSIAKVLARPQDGASCGRKVHLQQDASSC